MAAGCTMQLLLVAAALLWSISTASSATAADSGSDSSSRPRSAPSTSSQPSRDRTPPLLAAFVAFLIGALAAVLLDGALQASVALSLPSPVFVAGGESDVCVCVFMRFFLCLLSTSVSACPLVYLSVLTFFVPVPLFFLTCAWT